MINGHKTQKSKFIKLFISIIISLFIGCIQSYFTSEKWYISGSKLIFIWDCNIIISYNISKIIMKNI